MNKKTLSKGSAGIYVFALVLLLAGLTITSLLKSSRPVQVLGRESETEENSNTVTSVTSTTSQNNVQIETNNEKTEIQVENNNGDRNKNKLSFKTEKPENQASKSADVENENENENENEDEVKISTGAGEDIFEDSTASARSIFPLSINPLTRELTVTTPAGTRVVTILPFQAVANLLAHNPKIEVENEATASGSVSATLSASLEEKDNELVYRIPGHLNKNFLGLVPISIPTTSFVSAQTGSVLSEEQDLLGKLLNLLSK